MATVAQRRAEAQRKSQMRLAEALARLVGQSYRQLVTPETLVQVNGTTFAEQFIAAMAPEIVRARERSARTAAAYLRAESVPVLGPAPLPEEQLLTSLQVTGLAGLFRRIGQGVDPREAISAATKEVQGAAGRHALNGGRSALKRSILASDLGYYRVTRSGCCSFCAMLASRGAVYREDSFAATDPRFEGDGDAKVHDHCHCTLAVVRRGDSPPDFVQEMDRLWKETGGKLSGPDALNAFRRAYEAKYLRD